MPRAAVLRQIGEPLEIVDLVLSEPGDDEIEVAIVASGICHSDLSVQRGVVGVPLPVIPGHEGAGIVTRIGPGVTSVREGDHVVLSWVPSCGNCFWCVRDESYLCESGQLAADNGRMLDGTHRFSLDGSPVNQMSSLGTFAERIVVTVAVFGCGGVGLNVVQGARLAGAERIVAVDTSPAKLALAVRFGATDVVNGGDVDAVDALKELTAGRGVDVSFEVIGLQATIQQALRSTRRGGQTILVGIPDRDAIIPMRAMAAVYGGRTIRGCWYGSSLPQQDVPRILELHDRGELELRALISGELALDDVNRGLDDLASGTATRSVIRFPL